MQIELFTKTPCPYCSKAKAWLDKHAIPYRELPLDGDPENQQRFNALGLTGRSRTVPQIIADGERIGGYTDLIISDLVQRYTAAR